MTQPGLTAEIDQLAEEARRRLRHLDVTRDPGTAMFVADLVTFINGDGIDDPLKIHLRVMACLQLIVSNRENQCPDSSSRGWSP